MAKKAGIFEEIPSGHRKTGTDPDVFPSDHWPWRLGVTGSSRLCIYGSDTPAKLQPWFYHLIASPCFPLHIPAAYIPAA